MTRPQARSNRSKPTKMSDELTECPFCAEDIKATAIKCKHCGSMLDENPSSPPPAAVEELPSPPRERRPARAVAPQAKREAKDQTKGRKLRFHNTVVQLGAPKKSLSRCTEGSEVCALSRTEVPWLICSPVKPSSFKYSNPTFYIIGA